MSTKIKRKNNKIPIRVIVPFLITLSLCIVLITAMVLNRSQVENLTMEQLILEKSVQINDVISKLLYKTQMLSSLVLQNNGEAHNFEQIAATIVDDPAILNILIAPGGKVSNVYPLEGNEAVLGLDYFSEGAGNKEAVLAKESGELVLGGPFNAVQGGQVLVGRLPIFIDESDGEKRFWGLVSVTLRYPQALDGAKLNELRLQGFAYEIWRINPDNNERQIIASSEHSYSANTNYVERQLSIANSAWYFRILPVRMWYDFPETWIAIIVGMLVSLLVAAVTQNNHALKELKDVLETLSNTDALTGIHNRRCFLESAATQIDRVNRIGGEEFIIFSADIDKASVIQLAERIRTNIAITPVQFGDTSISTTASFGIAPAAPANDLEAALAMADDALYKAKHAGRNKVIFHEGRDATLKV